MRTWIIFSLMAILMLFSGCVSAPATDSGDAAGAAESGNTIVEVETFTLSGGAEVVADDKASGGKAVLLKDADASITSEVKLAPGNYIIKIFAYSKDGDHDAFYIQVDDLAEVRTYQNASYGDYDKAKKTATAEVGDSGMAKITIYPGETGMKIDYLEILPQ